MSKVYHRHRLNETSGKPRFTPRQVFEVARQAGFNNEEALRMTEIAKGESGWYPGIWGIDANAQQTRGYGLWAITPKAWGNIQGTALGRKFEELGGVDGMFNPLNNAKMAKFLYDESKKRTGNGLKPWYGTRYLNTMSMKDVGGRITKLPKSGDDKESGRTVKVSGTTQQFDEEGFKRASRRSTLAKFLERSNPNSLLLRTGAISSAPVNSSDFVSDKPITETVKLGDGPSRDDSPAQHHRSRGGKGWKAQGLSPIKELFYDPQGGWKGTTSIGAIGNHMDHVHVAAGPKSIIRLGKRAEDMGLHVGENPHWDKVDPVHVAGSNHYVNQAIDVSGTPKKMAAYTRYIRRLYGLS